MLDHTETPTCAECGSIDVSVSGHRWDHDRQEWAGPTLFEVAECDTCGVVSIKWTVGDKCKQ